MYETNDDGQSDDQELSAYSGPLGEPNTFWRLSLTAPAITGGMSAPLTSESGVHGARDLNIRPLPSPDETTIQRGAG
ncbi:MAG TPA: hypothetical protein VKQ36_03335, partial [Ktedonobacterales bacterium]|nr:hypothetical protein [Ktedonobacterales bacterium]